MFRPPLLALLVPVFAAAAPVPKARTPDRERLVSTWLVTAVDGDASYGGADTFVFEAGAACRTVHGNDQAGAFTWAWAVDPGESPRRLTLTQTGRDTPRTFECVYELDGDSLKIAFPTSETMPRPAAVAKAKGAMLYELKREPPPK